jgi:hypothetical protein
VSYRDLEQMMGERGVTIDHSTIYRWVQRYAPEIEKRLRWQWRGPRVAMSRRLAGVSVCGGGGPLLARGIPQQAPRVAWGQLKCPPPLDFSVLSLPAAAASCGIWPTQSPLPDDARSLDRSAARN